ncbi:MAG: hypothetical protein FWG61_06570 [Firmicutes bacterium]|nr:hypothetical protein [Bacillota bacterium]
MSKDLSGFERQLCDIQGRLFERSLIKEVDSADFMEKFMKSKTSEFYDLPYDRLQWAGEEYILEDLLEETSIIPAGEKFSKDELYWAGYVYRYWHLLTGESSREIYAQANARRMKECYLGFHTMDVVMAIEDLKNIHLQKSGQ